MTPIDATATLAALRAAMQKRGEFPAIAAVVRHLVGAVRDDGADEATIVRAVLSDATLTQKVLRLANSAMYAVFGDKVTTVSRAVQLIGTEAIVNVATGMRIMEGLSLANPGSTAAQVELTRASLAGSVAREIAAAMQVRDAEAAVVASLMRGLGRLLVAYYLPDAWQRVKDRHCAGEDEHVAAVGVLGMDFLSIGREIGEGWGLPKSLTERIAAEPKLGEGSALSHDDWMTAIAAFSTGVAAAQTGPGGPEAGAAAIADLAGRYTTALGMDSAALTGCIAAAATAFSSGTAEAVEGTDAANDAAADQVAGTSSGQDVHWPDLVDQALKDMHQMRKAQAGIGALSSAVLECAQRALRLDHGVMMVRHAATKRYLARVALGRQAEQVIGRLEMPEAFSPDVFHAALMHGKCINISDVHADRIRQRIPAWFTTAFPAVESFFVIPLSVLTRPVGFLVGAWETGDHHRQFTQVELNVISRLREPWQQAFEEYHLPLGERPAPRRAAG